MYTLNDFLNLMNYYKESSADSTYVSDLDPNLKILADDSRAKALTLFNENIDLPAIASDDYKRLKEFMVTWYATFRTFITTAKSATDVNAIPENQLNELLNSFGFNTELDKISHRNKIDFFYDLVNLYKIKGTPESIQRVLSYFGISDCEVIEYWLKYNDKQELIFHPEKVGQTKTGYGINVDDVPIENYTLDDPHWMLTPDQINQLFLDNKIRFPSKSPYVGIVPIIKLDSNTYSCLSILSRTIQDLYLSYQSGHNISKDLVIYEVNLSILDLYLSVVYLHNWIYLRNDSNDSEFLCFDGNISLLSNQEIIDLYENLNVRDVDLTRQQLKLNQEELYDTFYRNRSLNFLVEKDSAKNILANTNSEFKNLIDTYISYDKSNEIFEILLQKLSAWVNENISNSSQDLFTLLFGFGQSNYIKNVINVFKPYRARLILTNSIYKIQQPVQDSVIVEDELRTTIFLDSIVDWDTADSKAGFPLDYEIKEEYGIISNPPTISSKRILNMYVDTTSETKIVFEEIEGGWEIDNILFTGNILYVGIDKPYQNIESAINDSIGDVLIILDEGNYIFNEHTVYITNRKIYIKASSSNPESTILQWDVFFILDHGKLFIEGVTNQAFFLGDMISYQIVESNETSQSSLIFSKSIFNFNNLFPGDPMVRSYCFNMNGDPVEHIIKFKYCTINTNANYLISSSNTIGNWNIQNCEIDHCVTPTILSENTSGVLAISDYVSIPTLGYGVSYGVSSIILDIIPDPLFGTATFVISRPPIGCHRIYNAYIKDPNYIKLYVVYESVPEITIFSSRIESIIPSLNYYRVINMYVDQLDRVEIVFTDEDAIANWSEEWSLDSTARMYYSRISFDNGSYFDIGSSMDKEIKGESLETHIEQKDDIITNCHKGESVSSYNYKVACVPDDVRLVSSFGGWEDFDSGMFFDIPHGSDICKIKVYELLSKIDDNLDDGIANISINNLESKIEILPFDGPLIG